MTHATGLEHVEHIQKEQMTASYQLWVILTRLLAASFPALLLLLLFMDLNGSLCKCSCCLMEDQPCSWTRQHEQCHAPVVQVGCLAEKTGEDSARLQAPFDLHGSEEYLFGETDLPNDTTLQLDFTCATIMVCPSWHKTCRNMQENLCQHL